MILVTQKPKGFTIVETLFVLAIGGLIVTMSLLALNSTNRSKRDAQRKTGLTKINQNIASWTNEHHGILPTTLAELQTAARNDPTDASTIPSTPEGTHYNITVGPVSTACGAGSVNNVYYERVNDRAYRAKICLESGEFSENH